MKQCIYYLITALSVLLLAASCKSSKNTAKKSPIKTFVQPCSDLVQSDTNLRAWAMGRSDSETTTRKKATTMAYSELAGMLEKTVGEMIEEYATTLSEGKQAASKELLQQKTITTSNRVVKGAKIVCDQWTKDEETGQYANYIVMEINPDTYIRILSDELKKAGNTVDSDLLKDLFIKHISK